MTPNEMRLRLEAEMDILAGNSAPAISNYLASLFLNKAILSILTRIRKQGVEKEEYNKQFTAPLKGSTGDSFTSELVESSENHKNAEFWSLPDNLYLLLQESATLDKRDCFSGELIEADVFPVTEDYYNVNIRNYQKMPYCDETSGTALVWRISYGSDSQKKSELVTSKNCNIYKYNFRYLKRPTDIVVDLENPENQVQTEIYKEFHEDIVSRAALIGIENMRQLSRFESKAALNAQEGL